jgi:catechol 2,3-dioxygenase-like lactoylglutathione lyase family enzyme
MAVAGTVRLRRGGGVALSRTRRRGIGARLGPTLLGMAPDFGRVTPILRSFDEAKAREFYVDWLEFTVDAEHRFAPELPLYLHVSRDGLVLYISEHHGDATPGSHVRVELTGVRELHAELNGKRYKNNRPGLDNPPWGGVEMTVIDPCGNRITFHEAQT